MSQSKSKVYTVIERMLGGKSLAEALKGLYTFMMDFQRDLAADREAAVAYVRAREMLGDLQFDEVLTVARNEPDPQRAKVLVDALKWTAARNNSKYSDRIDVNVSQVISISDARSLALQRVIRPMSDQLPVQDGEIVASQALPAPEPTDTQSVRVPKQRRRKERVPHGPTEPDIFS